MGFGRVLSMVDYTEGKGKQRQNVEVRPWGQYTLLFGNANFKNDFISMKILEVNPLEKLSVQSHEQRGEYWYVLEGEVCAYRARPLETVEETLRCLQKYVLKQGDSIIIPQRYFHSLENEVDTTAKVIELSFGRYDEADITRYADRYGRV